MTRLWGVDPKIMCREHLLGEHKEMHQAVGTIRNHPHGETIIREHAERGQVATARLHSRHEDLAAEMERRGYNHDSPMNYHDQLHLGAINERENRQELFGRCDDCRERGMEA